MGDERDEPTTVVLVRHADISRPPADGDTLNEKGQGRAAALVHVLGDAGIEAVFATEYQRTQQTAAPLADHLGLIVEVRPAGAPADLAAEILADQLGRTVLVVSHSNVVPAVIHRLGGPRRPLLAEDEFDNLFWVTVGPGRTTVHHLRYGAAT